LKKGKQTSDITVRKKNLDSKPSHNNQKGKIGMGEDAQRGTGDIENSWGGEINQGGFYPLGKLRGITLLLCSGKKGEGVPVDEKL